MIFMRNDTNHDNDYEIGCFPTIIAIFCILIVMVLMSALMTGCKSIQYVPVETIKTEYRDHYVRDSIAFVQLDSILIREKGDSVIIEKYKYVYRDRDKLVTDTVYVGIEVEKPYPVEKQLTAWQKIKIDIGGILIAILAVFAIYFVYVLFRKLKP